MDRHSCLIMLLRWKIIAVVTVLASGGEDTYIFDDSPGLGRMFHGVGGISGGGVSS